jgi:putative membrane protein
MTSPRFPKSVFGAGSEPDPRFSLANERTFLAWVRTSLALILTGAAIEVLGIPATLPLRLTITIIITGLGILAAIWAWRSWMATEKALREAKPLPGMNIVPVFAILIALAGGMLLVGVVLGP